MSGGTQRADVRSPRRARHGALAPRIEASCRAWAAEARRRCTRSLRRRSSNQSVKTWGAVFALWYPGTPWLTQPTWVSVTTCLPSYGAQRGATPLHGNGRNSTCMPRHGFRAIPHTCDVIIIQSSLSSPVSDFKYQMCSSIRVCREDMARMVTYVCARSCATSAMPRQRVRARRRDVIETSARAVVLA